MIGTVLNIVLDPIMIQGMGLGATGAAVARDRRKFCVIDKV